MSEELQNKTGNRRIANSVDDNKKQFFGKSAKIQAHQCTHTHTHMADFWT